jgi:hypothetical protein
MSVVVYLKNSGVATSGEIIAYAKSDPAGFATLKKWACEQAANEGITLDADILRAMIAQGTFKLPGSETPAGA